MKKLSLTLGSIAAVVAPVASVVSCGPNYLPREKVNITKSDIKFYGPNGYGKIADTKIFEKIYGLDADATSFSIDKKNFSNGDKIKVTIKQGEEYSKLPNGTREQTFECVVSGLTEKVIPLFDVNLTDPKIVYDVNRSLIAYSLQEHSKVFYDFANVTKIPNGAFHFNGTNYEAAITALPENIDFSGVVILEGYNFLEVKQLPENIDFSHLKEINGLNGLTSLPEKINFSSVTDIDGLNGLTSLPENIDFSHLKEINGLNGLTSLPEKIDFSSVAHFGRMVYSTNGQIKDLALMGIRSLPNSIKFNKQFTWVEFQKSFPQLLKMYDEQWFNSHKKASTTP